MSHEPGHEPTVEEILASGIPLGGEMLPDPIGVPADFVAHAEYKPGLGMPPIKPGGVELPPRYFEGDDASPAGMSDEDIARLQRMLVAAGVLKGTTYLNGVWDEPSRQAYRSILTHANQSGLTAQQSLETWASAHTEQKPKVDPFLEPDYATLAQTVKQLVSERLGGREPTPAELDVLTSQLRGNYRAEYDAAVATTTAASDAAAAGADPATVVQDIDPVARFSEFFEQRYQPEMERREAISDMTNLRESFLGNVGQMDSMIGGAV